MKNDALSHRQWLFLPPEHNLECDWRAHKQTRTTEATNLVILTNCNEILRKKGIEKEYMNKEKMLQKLTNMEEVKNNCTHGMDASITMIRICTITVWHFFYKKKKHETKSPKEALREKILAHINVIAYEGNG